MKRFTIIGAVSAVMLAGAASAAPINSVTYTTSTTPAVSGIASLGLDFNDIELTLPQWNSALFGGATLTQIDINWVATLTGSADVTKGPNSGTVFNASVSAFISGSGPSTLSVTLNPTDPIIATPTAFNGNETKSYTLNESADVDQTFTAVDGATFLAFLGTGNVSYLFDGQDYSSSSQTGGASVEPLAFSSIDAIVTYTYEASTVPVPAALPLLGGGLALMGFVARRRRS